MIISRRDRRALVVGVPVLVTLLMARLTTSNLALVWSTYKGTSARALDSLAIGQHASIDITRLRIAVHELRALVSDMETEMIAASSLNAGAVELASLVASAADAAGVRLGALHVGDDTSHIADLGSVRVRGDLQGDVTQIASFLQLVEIDSVMLTVCELEITASQNEQTADEPQRLEGKFTIQATVRVTKAAP